MHPSQLIPEQHQEGQAEVGEGSVEELLQPEPQVEYQEKDDDEIPRHGQHSF
jgi:hypothetical protein